MTDLAVALNGLERMGEVLKGVKRLVVLTHDNPDPDSVSSACALAYLAKQAFNVPSAVRYGGIVGRAENRAMIRALHLRVKPMSDADFRPGTEFAVVDMQPKSGNTSFPKKRKPLIVIDHHVLRKTTKADFVDVRTEYGATATILSEYLLASGLEVPTTLATALSYGITSETQDLGREAREVDMQAYLSLFPKTNKKILAAIVHPRLPREFFVILSRALHHSRVYKNAIATTLGEIPNPDFVPLVADFILRCERMNWALCIGRFNGRLLLSIRTTNKKGEAGKFLRHLVGKKGTAGGHGMIAGGQVPCSMAEEPCSKVEEELVEKFLKKLGYGQDVETTPLLIDLPPEK